VYFTCGSLSIWTVLGSEIFATINLFFSRKFSRVYRCATLAFSVWGIPTNAYLTFKHDTFSLLPNLHTCISLVEVFRFGQRLTKRFSPMSTFFSLVSSRAFRYSPHSRFRCRDPNQCLPNILKLLLLALSKI